jgi:cytochrome c
MLRSLFFFLSLLSFIPDEGQAAPIHDAAKDGDTEAIAAALDSGADIDESDTSGTPLYIAVRRGHQDAVQLLLDRGANVNAPSDRGPALMAAVAKSQITLIKLLLEHGADPNSELDGELALHAAVEIGCLECVQALVEAGANVNAQTYDGKTPIHMAKLKGNSEIAGYLMEHGVIRPVPGPISAMLDAADVGKGETYFRDECFSCHNIEPQGSPKNGPNLWDVVGRDKASLTQMSYSQALRAWGGAWTYEDLNIYLSGPMLTTPGVYMETPGVPDEADRINVIAYLRTLSDNPVPLP